MPPTSSGGQRFADFALPDLGEGLTEGEILQWMVAVGDTVVLNQPIVEVETAKAAVEVPSPYAGLVTQIHHAAGETVDVGSPIITIDTDPSAGPVEQPPTEQVSAVGQLPTAEPLTAEPPAAGSPADGEVATGREPGQEQGALIGEVGANGRTATLVGYGPRSVTATRRARTDRPVAPVVTAAPPAPPAPARVSALQVGQTAAARAGGVVVLAKPPVRKLAKELGVDLSLLRGTGTGGTITRVDVEAAAAPVRRYADYADGADDAGSAGGPADGDGWFAQADPTTRETRIPVKGVRRLTADAMVASAFSAPHVTEFLTLDMTPTMELRQRVAALPEFADVKVTPLLFVAKALLLAVARNPGINSTFTGDEIVVKHYVNLGVAAATPRGLLVPNVKDADQLSLLGLAQALQALTETAREGRTAPADMAHGTITITNVGTFGVDTGTPILNPGESAILCFGAVRPTPWVVDGEVVVRQVTQLSLSFDHRNVDGQLGSQFLSDVARVLSNPELALVWG